MNKYINGFIGFFTGIWAIFGVLSLLPIMMSPMMFDAPGSLENVDVLTMFWSLVTFPIVCLVASILAFILVWCKRLISASVVVLLPLINIGLIWSLIR